MHVRLMRVRCGGRVVVGVDGAGRVLSVLGRVGVVVEGRRRRVDSAAVLLLDRVLALDRGQARRRDPRGRIQWSRRRRQAVVLVFSGEGDWRHPLLMVQRRGRVPLLPVRLLLLRMNAGLGLYPCSLPVQVHRLLLRVVKICVGSWRRGEGAGAARRGHRELRRGLAEAGGGVLEGGCGGGLILVALLLEQLEVLPQDVADKDGRLAAEVVLGQSAHLLPVHLDKEKIFKQVIRKGQEVYLLIQQMDMSS